MQYWQQYSDVQIHPGAFLLDLTGDLRPRTHVLAGPVTDFLKSQCPQFLLLTAVGFQINVFLALAICGTVLAGIQLIIAATGASAVHNDYDVYFGHDSAVRMIRNGSAIASRKLEVKCRSSFWITVAEFCTTCYVMIVTFGPSEVFGSAPDALTFDLHGRLGLKKPSVCYLLNTRTV